MFAKMAVLMILDHMHTFSVTFFSGHLCHLPLRERGTGGCNNNERDCTSCTECGFFKA